MKEKQEEICECGHDYDTHLESSTALINKGCKGCTIEDCPCKKFTPKKKAIVLNNAEGYYKSKGTQNHKKGCGKFIPNNLAFDPEDLGWVCGQFYDALKKVILCPTCQEKEK